MISRLVVLAAAALLGACATAPQQRDALGNPRIERLDPQTLAELGPAGPARLSLDEVVSLSRSGIPPGEINDRLFQTASRFALSDSDRARLRAAGVAEEVIAFIDSHERDARRIDEATRQADRDAQARRDRDAALRLHASRDAYWGWPGPWSPRVFPYAGYGWSRWGSGWYGGVGIGF